MTEQFPQAEEVADTGAGEKPLPSGWSSQIAPNGRVFFIGE